MDPAPKSATSRRRRGVALARSVVGATAYWSGAAQCYELLARPTGAIVLMYHSVSHSDTAGFIDPANRVTARQFERHMAFLSANRRVVALSSLTEAIAAGRTPEAGTVAITLDDGYLDTFTVAAPILARHRLPATVFLATGYVARGENQWADVVHWCFEQRRATPRALAWDGRSYAFASARERFAARREMHRRLLEATYSERSALLESLRATLRPAGTPPRLTMHWDEARELRRRYPLIELGGHTRDHLDLRTHRGALAREEISGCAADLRRELGGAASHFCYPYGRWCDETRGIVAACGWSAAVAGAEGRAGRDTDPFVIPRIEAPRGMTQLRFKTSGAFPGILAWMRRPSRAPVPA